MSELDRIFNEFEDRKRGEQEAKEQQRLKEAQLRQETTKVLSEIVSPVLRELSADIERKGHQITITEYLERHTYPSIELNFKPKIKNVDLSVSTLRFVHTDSGQIQVKQDIRAKKEKVPGYDHGEGIQPSKVDQEWVRSKVFAFLESVLRAY